MLWLVLLYLCQIDDDDDDDYDDAGIGQNDNAHDGGDKDRNNCSCHQNDDTYRKQSIQHLLREDQLSVEWLILLGFMLTLLFLEKGGLHFTNIIQLWKFQYFWIKVFFTKLIIISNISDPAHYSNINTVIDICLVSNMCDKIQ